MGELLREIEVESSNLSQQLAVLRRAGLVTTRKEGSTVHYSLVSPQIAELMAVARSILTSVLSRAGRHADDLEERRAERSRSARSAEALDDVVCSE